jgi:hypothetical protein
MRKLLLLLAAAGLPFLAAAQCSTTNATGCQCANSAQSDCDLLPDITISWSGILNYMGGPDEYSQVCNPPCNGNDGRLRLSASTPNIGFGPLTVRGSSYFVCGTDTFTSNPGPCPDGSTPRQLIKQRIYHKNGNTMSYYDRWAGGMTYHASHGHNHVDDWGIFTLRIQDPNDPDPRNWPIVATGGKLGFCLMDYYQCGDASASGHCRDNNTVYNQGNPLVNANFPNFGLGGGTYNCSVVEQGISSGYTDVYSEALDLMWITLPPDLCNGQYWIVIQVDPHNNFMESDETNNYTAVPFTLTQQNAPNTPAPVNITCNRPSPKVCVGDSIKLTATAGTSFSWSTGATTQNIWVSNPGTYSVTVTGYCGTATSSPFTVYSMPVPSGTPVATGDTICANGVATLTASGPGTLKWMDGNGNVVGTGSTFNTPSLSSSTTYYVSSNLSFIDTTHIGAVNNMFGTGAYNTSTGNYLTFSAFSQMTLISVKVYAQAAGSQTITLRDSSGAQLNTITVTVPAGESRVTLNWPIAPGNAYRLGGNVTNLYRNNTNSTDFPYILNGVMSITGSSAGPAYYYYYYDWEVETTNQACSSSSIPVTVVVDPCVTIDERDLNNNISVYPNPADNSFDLKVALPGTASMEVRICDVLGKTIMMKEYTGISGIHTESIDIASLPNGAYLVNVKIGERTYFRKLIIQ